MSCEKCGCEVFNDVKYAKIEKNSITGEWDKPEDLTDEAQLCHKCKEIIDLKIKLAFSEGT